MDLEEWAMDNAARVVQDVERHGLAITWSEAHKELLKIGRFLDCPAHLDCGDGELLPLPADDEPLWRRLPDFAEHVACSIVHYRGRHFVPTNPATSSAPVAVPWAIASELVTWLSFLMTRRLGATSPNDDGLRELAVLVLHLSSRVTEEMAWIADDDFADERIQGRRCLLMCSREVWKAAALLRDAADNEDLTNQHAAGIDEGLRA